ncbi:MAG: hypothetical protein ACYDEB_03405 [Dehalococcoidia bacterium]
MSSGNGGKRWVLGVPLVAGAARRVFISFGDDVELALRRLSTLHRPAQKAARRRDEERSAARLHDL